MHKQTLNSIYLLGMEITKEKAYKRAKKLINEIDIEKSKIFHI